MIRNWIKYFGYAALFAGLVAAPMKAIASSLEGKVVKREEVHETIENESVFNLHQEKFLLPPPTPLTKGIGDMTKSEIFKTLKLKNNPQTKNHFLYNETIIENLPGTEADFLYERLGPREFFSLMGIQCGIYDNKNRIENLIKILPLINYHVHVSGKNEISALDVATLGLIENGFNKGGSCNLGEEIYPSGILQKHLEDYVRMYSPEFDSRSLNLFKPEHEVFLMIRMMRGLNEILEYPELIPVSYNGGRSIGLKFDKKLRKLEEEVFALGIKEKPEITLGDMLEAGKDILPLITRKHLIRSETEYRRLVLENITWDKKNNLLEVGRDPRLEEYNLEITPQRVYAIIRAEREKQKKISPPEASPEKPKQKVAHLSPPPVPKSKEFYAGLPDAADNNQYGAMTPPPVSEKIRNLPQASVKPIQRGEEDSLVASSYKDRVKIFYLGEEFMEKPASPPIPPLPRESGKELGDLVADRGNEEKSNILYLDDRFRVREEIYAYPVLPFASEEKPARSVGVAKYEQPKKNHDRNKEPMIRTFYSKPQSFTRDVSRTKVVSEQKDVPRVKLFSSVPYANPPKRNLEEISGTRYLAKAN